MLHTDVTVIEQAVELLSRARRVVVTCHIAPDGDALGSSLALQRVLENRGLHVDVITPDVPTATLAFLPGYRRIVPASKYPDRAQALIARADLTVMLDFNDMHRLDRLADMFEPANAPRIVVDHHLDPRIEAVVTFSDPKASSTCQLLYQVLVLLGLADSIDTVAASCLYTGIVTDTGNFAYNSSSPELYGVVADLLRMGVDKDRIYNAVNRRTESSLRICGHALSQRMTLYPEYHTAVIALSNDELKQFGYRKGDSEGLVNKPLDIDGIDCSLYLREDAPGFVKISARSRGDMSVNALCEEYFGGGGHFNAAGGEFYGTLDQALQIVTDNIAQWGKFRNTRSRHS